MTTDNPVTLEFPIELELGLHLIDSWATVGR